MGYEGSGPADLALAMLVDYFGERPPRDGYQSPKFSQWTVKSKAWKLHQLFKRAFIAKLNDKWTLYGMQIQTWLKEQEVNGFTRDDAEAKVGKWVRTRVAWANIEAGTIGKVVRAEQQKEVWKVVIQWDWPKTWHNRLSRDEYEEYLEEEDR